MVVSGLMVHMYVGVVFPEEKPAFCSMITRTVDELYAYRHHFKWWRKVKMQEADAEAQHPSEPDVIPSQAEDSSGQEARNNW
jgi:cytochrome b subunit of formate dehydrogenase